MALALSVLLALLAHPALSLAEGVAAITRPSEDVRLPFVSPGRVAKVLVKEGDNVAANQILMAQEDEVEQIRLAQLDATARDLTKILYAEAQLEQKQVNLKRLNEINPNATNATEKELAQLDVTSADLSKQLAEFEHRQDLLKYDEMKAQIERMKLKSPFAGKIEQIVLHVGEGPDAGVYAVRLVKIDPLWIDVPVPLGQALKLEVGGVGKADFSPFGGGVVEGKVVHIAAIGDAASDTLTVRLEIPNPSSRPAGERVLVSFPRGKLAEVSGPASQPITQEAQGGQKEE
ncbi:MAG: efflux RND transporter periplasmic adaptor subunit [Phycisphaerae bacterium]